MNTYLLVAPVLFINKYFNKCFVELVLQKSKVTICSKDTIIVYSDADAAAAAVLVMQDI